MKEIFKFKQFQVNQTDCAMRINTDGVLLAATAQQEQPKYVLDIGTGTGVVAMMLAQRYPKALIDAVEIEKMAADRAKINFLESPFSDRLNVENVDIKDFISTKKYDLIVSNPPYFVNDLKSNNLQKGIARHASKDFFLFLTDKVSRLMTDEGSFWFVLPVKQANNLLVEARKYALYPSKIIDIHSDKNKMVFRKMIGLTRKDKTTEFENFYIYESEKVYTKAYQELLKDFFIVF